MEVDYPSIIYGDSIFYKNSTITITIKRTDWLTLTDIALL